jgi:hypothetical protein
MILGFGYWDVVQEQFRLFQEREDDEIETVVCDQHVVDTEYYLAGHCISVSMMILMKESIVRTVEKKEKNIEAY